MPFVFITIFEGDNMRKLIITALLVLLAGSAGAEEQNVKKDAASGVTVIDSETLKVGYFTPEDRTIFTWRSDAPDKVIVTVDLMGIKSIEDISFSFDKTEIKAHSDSETPYNFNLGDKKVDLRSNSATAYSSSALRSRKSFLFKWQDFLLMASAAAKSVVKIQLSGAGKLEHTSNLDDQDYKLKILPFIDKVNKLKKFKDHPILLQK